MPHLLGFSIDRIFTNLAKTAREYRARGHRAALYGGGGGDPRGHGGAAGQLDCMTETGLHAEPNACRRLREMLAVGGGALVATY